MTKPSRTERPKEPATPPALGPFPYRDYAEAHSLLLAATERGAFYASLCAISGMGKTCLARTLTSELDRHRFWPVYIAASRVSATGFARHLARLLRVPVRRSALEIGSLVTEALRDKPTHAIVWVDEADRLPIDTLTEIRSLAEIDDSVPQTFSVILSGAPELVGLLDDQRLFALKRRITVPLTLTGLARDEVDAFILYRFGAAEAGRVPSQIKDDLFERTQGTPALIVTILRAALDRAKSNKLDDTHLREALHVLRM